MTISNTIPADAVLVAIDIAKVRNEVLIEAPGDKRLVARKAVVSCCLWTKGRAAFISRIRSFALVLVLGLEK